MYAAMKNQSDLRWVRGPYQDRMTAGPIAKEVAVWLHLALAVFWFVTGVLVQIYWSSLQPMMNIPLNRETMGFIFFALFSNNFLRWRFERSRMRFHDDRTPPPKPKVVHREYDPTFDFSKDDEPPANRAP
jgi:hypothetical protein